MLQSIIELEHIVTMSVAVVEGIRMEHKGKRHAFNDSFCLLSYLA